jgi:hypothetical protein
VVRREGGVDEDEDEVESRSVEEWDALQFLRCRVLSYSRALGEAA